MVGGSSPSSPVALVWNMKDTPNKIVNYIKETRAEAKKVTWPARQYVISATGVILVIVLFLGTVVMLLDMGLSRLMLFLTAAF